MQLFAVCLSLALAQLPATDYEGPAYVHRGGKVRSLAHRLTGEALAWCVRAGARPEWVERMFGPPLLQSQFGGSPVAWWYPTLGTTAYFPPRLFAPAKPAERVWGGIE